MEATKKTLAECQDKITKIDRSLSESLIELRSFEDNARMRKSRKEIQEIDDEIERLDEDGARKANQKFDTEYQVQRVKQQNLQTRVSAFLFHRFDGPCWWVFTYASF